MCDTIDAPLDPGDTCFVANQNIARAERDEHRRPRTSTGTNGATRRWDGKSLPKYLDRIDAHFHLDAVERERLYANGFVVLDRLAYTDYASAFHDVFQEELPLYVGIDSAFHALFRGTDLVLTRIEKKTLKPALFSLLRKLRGGLRGARRDLRPDTAADLDDYLGIAQALAVSDDGSGDEKLSLFGREKELAALFDAATSFTMTSSETGIELFGRNRVIDFSQLTPRGHYAEPASDGGLAGYFKSMMWLSRLEWNLVSRSCRSSQPGARVNPEETPREARDALALAEIAEQTGALTELALFEKIYGVFAGRREDVSVSDLLRLARQSGIRSGDKRAPEKLKAAIGSDFQRTVRTHFMPEGTTVLPAIATLFGPRITPDTAPLTHLVHDRVPNRMNLGAADVAYVLGHDRAKQSLQEDLRVHPTLQKELDDARAATAHAALTNDIYAHWLRAILALGAAPVGTVPSFFANEAYQDFRMNSALVGYGQLRRTFVLLAAQGYDAYGCEIPDAYVEPLLPAWTALLAHVRKLRTATSGFAPFERVLTMLRDIAQTESTGAALSEPQRRWLGMIAESVSRTGHSDSGEPAKWTGWYFDMFEDRAFGAAKTAAFVADYFTETNADRVKYIGADGPRLGIFIVDSGGVPRAMVGPVAKGYETESPLSRRLDDEKALTHAPKVSPWRTTFAVPQFSPQLGLMGRVVTCEGDAGPPERRIAMRAHRPIGKVSLTLLDHHGDGLGPSATIDVDTQWKTVAFSLPPSFAKTTLGVEALDVHVHDLAVAHAGQGPFHETSTPSVFTWADPPSALLPHRPQGLDDFAIPLPAPQPDPPEPEADQ